MKKKQFGNYGERIVAKYLVEKGYEILGRNIHSRWGEIDIVARKGRTLHFVEVKTRSSLVYGSGYTKQKQKRCLRTISTYLLEQDLKHKEWQIDLCIVRVQAGRVWIRHQENLEDFDDDLG